MQTENAIFNYCHPQPIFCGPKLLCVSSWGSNWTKKSTNYVSKRLVYLLFSFSCFYPLSAVLSSLILEEACKRKPWVCMFSSQIKAWRDWGLATQYRCSLCNTCIWQLRTCILHGLAQIISISFICGTRQAGMLINIFPFECSVLDTPPQKTWKETLDSISQMKFPST